MRNYLADGSNFVTKESDNAFESNDTVVTSSDIDINEVDKLKTKVMALKMFVTDQLKQSVGNPKTPECNCNCTSDIYIKSLIEKIHNSKVENKRKTLLFSLFYSRTPRPLFLMIYFEIMIKLMRPLQLLMMTIPLMILMILRMKILMLRITT